MVYMNTYDLKASERGVIHTFLLVRILSEDTRNCRIHSFDLGQFSTTICGIFEYLCDGICEYILDDIVKNRKFYINGAEMRVVGEEPTEAILIHKGIQYKIIS